MKDRLVPGISTTVKILIDQERTIAFMGNKGRVYATPSMVLDIESIARNWLINYLDENEDTVGTHVSVDHMAATVEGDTVEIKITVNQVNGRSIEMSAYVKDSLEEVGNGNHNRFVVDKAKTFDRLEAKRAKIEAL
jgi:predicted thioesterase